MLTKCWLLALSQSFFLNALPSSPTPFIFCSAPTFPLLCGLGVYGIFTVWPFLPFYILWLSESFDVAFPLPCVLSLRAPMSTRNVAPVLPTPEPQRDFPPPFPKATPTTYEGAADTTLNIQQCKISSAGHDLLASTVKGTPDDLVNLFGNKVRHECMR